MRIFECCHANAPFYTQNEIVIPIQGGAALSDRRMPIIGDDQGGISVKNPFFCELTVMYWALKNCSAEVVGFCHYRRYFNFASDDWKCHAIGPDFLEKWGMTESVVKAALSNVDIILPVVRKLKTSLYQNYRDQHVVADMDCVLEILRERSPQEYRAGRDAFLKGRTFYPANMLIARKSVFEAYATWLFDVLFELERRRQGNWKLYDSYQMRVAGFLSERLMSVWILLHPELRIVTRPCLFVETNEDAWREVLSTHFTKEMGRHCTRYPFGWFMA